MGGAPFLLFLGLTIAIVLRLNGEGSALLHRRGSLRGGRLQKLAIRPERKERPDSSGRSFACSFVS